MKISTTILAAAIGSAFSVAAFAQTAAQLEQRDVQAQQRIEQGLKSGQLTTQEASRLKRGEARIDRMEAQSLKDGTLTNAERARITNAQNRESQAIYREKHDAQTGNPNSPSSQRMQADVQRNINQQQRIAQGARSGQLTGREEARLDRGESRIDRREAHAGADGHVGGHEQHGIQRAENHESNHIQRARYNRHGRG